MCSNLIMYSLFNILMLLNSFLTINDIVLYQYLQCVFVLFLLLLAIGPVLCMLVFSTE